MVVFSTALLVWVGGVQADPPARPPIPARINKPLPSTDIQAKVASKLAEIKSAMEKGDTKAAQAALKDATASGSWWADEIYAYFYIDPWYPDSDGCQEIYVYSWWYGGVVPMPCMMLAPMFSWAMANYIPIYIDYYGWGYGP